MKLTKAILGSRPACSFYLTDRATELNPQLLMLKAFGTGDFFVFNEIGVIPNNEIIYLDISKHKQNYVEM